MCKTHYLVQWFLLVLYSSTRYTWNQLLYFGDEKTSKVYLIENQRVNVQISRRSYFPNLRGIEEFVQDINFKASELIEACESWRNFKKKGIKGIESHIRIPHVCVLCVSRKSRRVTCGGYITMTQRLHVHMVMAKAAKHCGRINFPSRVQFINAVE